MSSAAFRTARGFAAFLAALLLWSCALEPDAHVPPFARVPYEPISRQVIVAVALREWRAFGSRVDDGPDLLPSTTGKPERDEGLWQRVGEYWWLGLDAGAKESRWTGKHDENGKVFPPGNDGDYAWSAAFVSYVIRIAGAAKRFPYAPDHAHYIDIAKRQALGETSGWIVTAEAPEAYAPKLGDLLCFGREEASGLTFEQLPFGSYFPAHCEFVVDVSTAGTISVVGGNDRDAVVLRHVAVQADGKLAVPPYEGGRWLAVLRMDLPSP